MTENKDYTEGYRAGQQAGARQEQMNRTVVHLRFMMRNLSIPLEEAMAILQLPKKERKIYRNIFGKAIPKKVNTDE